MSAQILIGVAAPSVISHAEPGLGMGEIPTTCDLLDVIVCAANTLPLRSGVSLDVNRFRAHVRTGSHRAWGGAVDCVSPPAGIRGRSRVRISRSTRADVRS